LNDRFRDQCAAYEEVIRELNDDPTLLPALRSGIGPIKSAAQEVDELEEIYKDVIAKRNFKVEELS
jgi:hypothetical protein